MMHGIGPNTQSCPKNEAQHRRTAAAAAAVAAAAAAAAAEVAAVAAEAAAAAAAARQAVEHDHVLKIFEYFCAVAL